MDHWYVYLLLAYLVTLVPVVGKYFSVLNTLFHEVGHGIFALLFRGNIRSISLFANTEGEIVTSSPFWLGRVVTSLAGYPFSSFTAFLCFYFIDKNLVEYVLYGFITITTFSLLLWIRNLYGLIWSISFIALCGYLIWNGNRSIQTHFTFFLSAIILTQSVATAFAILKLSLVHPKQAGDATNLANETYIPAFIWGMVFFGQSLYVAYMIFKNYIML